MRRTIFERYGGFAKVNRVVTNFYDKILESPVTSPYFANTDMRALIEHQTRFIAFVMGGPASFTNDHLERVHARHKISEGAFDEACMLLVETLEDMDFEDEDIQVVKDEFVKEQELYCRKGAVMTTPLDQKPEGETEWRKSAPGCTTLISELQWLNPNQWAFFLRTPAFLNGFPLAVMPMNRLRSECQD
jgi:hemoglobin